MLDNALETIGWLPVWLIPLGLAVLIAGLRGRCIGSHRHCRKCNYDLSGNPEAVSCAECGARLSRRRAVMVGRRRRYPLVALAGVGLVVSVVAINGYALWQEDNEIKPVWWLVLEADHAGEQRGEAAFDELFRRYEDEELTAGQVNRLIERALAHQADRDAEWQSRWGELVQTAWQRDRRQERQAQQAGEQFEADQWQVSEQQWRRYLEQGMIAEPRLELVKPVRHGGSIAFILPFEQEPRWHFGSRGMWHVGIRIADMRASIRHHDRDGRATAWELGNSSRFTSSLGPEGFLLHPRLLPRPLTIRSLQLPWDELEPGEYELAVVAKLAPGVTGAQRDGSWTMYRVALSKTIRVVEADAPHALELIDEPGHVAALRCALKPTRLRVDRWEQIEGGEVSDLPVSVGFEVLARSPAGTEHRVGELYYSHQLPRGRSSRAPTLHRSLSNHERITDWPEGAERATIIFRPIPERAEEALRYGAGVWGEPIVFEDVPVE